MRSAILSAAGCGGRRRYANGRLDCEFARPLRLASCGRYLSDLTSLLLHSECRNCSDLGQLPSCARLGQPRAAVPTRAGYSNGEFTLVRLRERVVVWYISLLNRQCLADNA